MKLSERGATFIHGSEGVRLYVYDDLANGKPWTESQKGNPTIGWGHLCTPAEVIKYRNGITRAEADRLFAEDVKWKAEVNVDGYVKQPLTQEQYDALVSLVFNIGGGAFSRSPVLERINAGDFDGVPLAMQYHIKSKGVVYSGLITRRLKEAMLFTYGEYVTGGNDVTIQLSWPTEYNKITQYFGDRPSVYQPFNLPGHEGLDFRAYSGSKVFACADGIVKAVYTDLKHNYGVHVRISHEGGWETIYAHLARATIAVGAKVKRKQQIGVADNTGFSDFSHLHLTLKKAGATARGETKYPNDIVNPLPYLLGFNEQPQVVAPRRVLPNHPLRGLHGDGAVDWMVNNGQKGWAVEVVYAGEAFKPQTFNDTGPADIGIRVIRRLNYSWAKGDGGLGTFPNKRDYQRFIEWALNVITNSKGVWGWQIGNEPNRKAERPNPDEVILPSDVTYLYNAIWDDARTSDRISPPAIDPTNYESGDPRDYFKQIVTDLKGAEWFALHGYGYRVDQAVNDSRRFNQPMGWQYYSFRMWEPFADVLFSFQRDGQFPYRQLPIVITEANHLYKRDGTTGWEQEAGGWVEDAYDYVREWNSGPGDQFIHGLCLYRYDGDSWAIKDKPDILEALKRSGGVAVNASKEAA